MHKNRLFSSKWLAVSTMMALGLAGTMATSTMAATLKWASQGDVSTHDPHAQNENFNNQMNGQIYEQLLTRDKSMNIVPCLVTAWKQTSPTTWVFTMRQGVKFHDGSALKVEDLMYSVERSAMPTSNMKDYGLALGKPTKIDDNTFQLTTPVPNPVLPDMIGSGNIFVMSKAWAEKNGAIKPQDFASKEETFASRNAMGTGPYTLVSREPDVKTVLKQNTAWWGIKDGRFTGNVTDIIYRPIKSAPTRVAALLTGEVDFILDPPVQDIQKLKADPSIKIYEGAENRIIFIGMDQARDELLYSTVKGKNPFKDKRVRMALYQSVDVEAIKTSVMRGMSIPSAITLSAPERAGVPKSLEKRHPLDVVKAKALLAEAGYPSGFEVTIDCPNDRYINDEKICIALAGMWAKIGVKLKVNSMTKANYFPKTQKLDTSMYLLGWGGSTTDAMFTLKPVLHSRSASAGEYNRGNYKVPALDALIVKAEGEMNPKVRQDFINQAMQIHHDEVLHIPLHRQMIPWASSKKVTVIHRADNWLETSWVTIK